MFPNTETERISFVAVKIFVGDDVGVACSFLICLYGNRNKVSEAKGAYGVMQLGHVGG